MSFFTNYVMVMLFANDMLKFMNKGLLNRHVNVKPVPQLSIKNLLQSFLCDVNYKYQFS